MSASPISYLQGRALAQQLVKPQSATNDSGIGSRAVDQATQPNDENLQARADQANGNS